MLHDIAPGSATNPSHAVLRTAEDISHLIRRLFIALDVPRIELDLHTLPALHVQHTQERLEQLRERTIGSWGEVALGVTLAVGGFVAWTEWTSLRQWQQMGNVLVATVAAWVAGQVLEAAWRRLRLIWALKRLRRQVRSGKGLYAGSTQAPVDPEYDSATLQPGAGLAALSRRMRLADAAIAEPKSEPARIVRASDIARVFGRVLIPWPLPRIVLNAPELPVLDLQRTQQRITRLSASCNCVLGALLAAMTLLAGGLYIVMTSAEKWWVEWWEWPRYWDAGPGMRLTLFVLAAGIAGWLMETVLTRLRLAVVLLGLWARLRVGTKEGR
ncbi:MAG: hypothetical protein M3Y79_07260 [Pseudomonadota bacterium]|nr:hypothetical protein [Pseudomonadota bacterium]